MIKFINEYVKDFNYFGDKGFMKKRGLRLAKEEKCKVQFINSLKNNSLSLDPIITINDDSIKILYNKDDIHKIGFLNIDSVEVYKEDKVIYENDDISQYEIKFPKFLESGVYEVKTIISNKEGTIKKSLISSFEFFKGEKNNKVDIFDINLKEDNRDLNISFVKKFGNIDLSDINLSNITFINGKGEELKGIVCKLSSLGYFINFRILDVFNNHNVKSLIPNEVYTLKIKVRGGELLKSFYFEYVNKDVNKHNIIDHIYFEFKEILNFGFKKGILHIKLSELIDVEDYEYFIFGIKSSFLYFKSQGKVKDTLVFECVFKNDSGCFEILISKEFIIPIKVYYDLSKGEFLYNKEDVKINKNENKYDLYFESKRDKVSLRSLLDETTYVKEDDKDYFKGLNLLNKSNEIYALVSNDEIISSFILTNAISPKFNAIDFTLNIDGNYINGYVDKDEIIKGEYIKNYSNDIYIKDGKFSIVNNSNGKISFKFLTKDNKVYYNEAYVYEEEIECYIKYYRPENVYLDENNSLVLIDKFIGDEFEDNFTFTLLSSSKEVLYRKELSSSSQKIIVNDLIFKYRGIYYIKILNNFKYKMYTLYINPFLPNNKIFINNVHDSNINLYIKSLINNKSYVDFKLLMVLDNKEYEVLSDRFILKSKEFNLPLDREVLIKNTEYKIIFKFPNNREDNIRFYYLGDKEDFHDNYQLSKGEEINIYEVLTDHL